jgi:signal recognition particle subunit SEC65
MPQTHSRHTQSGRKSKQQDSKDAVSILKQDHANVKELFKEFKKLAEDEGSEEMKQTLIESACQELKIHTQIEEEIFYPAVREAIDEELMMDEAEVEHASAKDLIEQIEGMSPGDPKLDATFLVLAEYVQHHIQEEEGEMFPKVKQSDLDLEALGTQLKEQKTRLKEEMEETEEKA